MKNNIHDNHLMLHGAFVTHKYLDLVQCYIKLLTRGNISFDLMLCRHCVQQAYFGSDSSFRQFLTQLCRIDKIM